MDKKKTLVWIDLEMTGLNPHVHTIVEIATIITDNELNILHTGPSIVINQPDEALERMDNWVRNQHTKSGLLSAIKASTITMQQAEEQTLALLQQYCIERTAPLCGNSVWQDANFMRHYMPKLLNFLNYRIIDVTSVKEVVNRWYPNNPHTFFVKKDMHRALIDIEESIEELKYYRKHFFVNAPALE